MVYVCLFGPLLLTKILRIINGYESSGHQIIVIFTVEIHDLSENEDTEGCDFVRIALPHAIFDVCKSDGRQVLGVMQREANAGSE